MLRDTLGEQKLPPFKSPHFSITLFCLFVYLEDRWEDSGRNAAVSIEVIAVGLEWRLLETRAQLLSGPISNIAILAVQGLSVVTNMTASGLCAVPFIPFERK